MEPREAVLLGKIHLRGIVEAFEAVPVLPQFLTKDAELHPGCFVLETGPRRPD